MLILYRGLQYHPNLPLLHVRPAEGTLQELLLTAEIESPKVAETTAAEGIFREANLPRCNIQE